MKREGEGWTTYHLRYFSASCSVGSRLNGDPRRESSVHSLAAGWKRKAWLVHALRRRAHRDFVVRVCVFTLEVSTSTATLSLSSLVSRLSSLVSRLSLSLISRLSLALLVGGKGSV